MNADADTATGPRTVVVAPDSFKGSMSAALACSAIAAGWHIARPQDDVRCVPLADGGEGTADAIRDATSGSRSIGCAVTGPDGRDQTAAWVLLPDGTAVVELAAASGLPLLAHADPLGAQTTGFGQLLRAAALHPDTRRIVATVGGSAATDGGTGALRALGARFLDAAGADLPPGGGALTELVRVDTSELIAPPPGGIEVLSDVTSPLTGTHGAATVFGPQKGADTDRIAVLDAALARLAAVIGGDPDAAGAGAAGGSAFGLATLWGARLRPGAPAVAEIVGLTDALAGADLVITGEGRFDEQSLRGKVVGHVVESARCPVALLAGGVMDSTETTGVLDGFVATATLVELAGSLDAALDDPQHWALIGGEALADSVFGRTPS
ncbi:MAG: glycerate kinase [Nakamurella sp.]